MARILLEGCLSEKMRIDQGIRQGCLLSPLFFNIFLETFAILMLMNKEIERVSCGNVQMKIALYTDDVVCFLKNLLTLVSALMSILKDFERISAYKINHGK